MKIGEFLVCGEPCEDAYCYKHILQIKSFGWLPRPCKVCGVGVINTYCNTCILETREREQNILLAKEFKDDEPSIGSFGWHLKNQGEARVLKPDAYMSEFEYCFGLRMTKKFTLESCTQPLHE